MAVQRMSDSPLIPKREQKRTSTKYIFISCEGSNTEWDYFNKVINFVYNNIKNKVQVYNVLEDILKKDPSERTLEENKLVNSSNPSNVLKKMMEHIESKDDEFNLSEHKDEDEFWLILDIDKNTDRTPNQSGKSRYSQWIEVLSQCQEKGYNYAVSNPFFELWLLLHFDNANEQDRSFAVTDTHPYEPTDNFKNRLENLGVPLSGRKRKNIGDTEILKYTKKSILDAMNRAKALDNPPCSDYPMALGTTVYRLLESIVQIDEQYSV